MQKKSELLEFYLFYKEIIYLKTVTLKNVNDYKTNKKATALLKSVTTAAIFLFKSLLKLIKRRLMRLLIANFLIQLLFIACNLGRYLHLDLDILITLTTAGRGGLDTLSF